MKKIETIEELHGYLLDILVEFDAFCRKNGLRYMLAYGSCLGAVRHGGFIPWDDDLDVAMPRPDYDRLIELTMQHEISENMKLLCFEKDEYYEYPFAKLVNTRTYLDENHYKGQKMGLFMDIFPLDGANPDMTAQKKIGKKHARAGFVLFGSFSMYERNGMPFWTYIGGCIGAFFLHRCYHLVRKHCIRKMDRLSRITPYDEADEIGCIAYGYSEEREFRPKDRFFPAREALFEGRKIMIPADAEDYLEKMYGDYMKLPPENERQGHPFKAYVLED